MSATRQSYGHSGATLAKAQSRLERYEHGETPDQIARRDGTSRGAVMRDLRLAREDTETKPTQQTPPRRRMGERAMLFRAWTVTRNLDVFRLLGLGKSMLWISVIMQIHLNSDGDLWFGPRCRSLDELARGAGGTEADLEELIGRDLLIRLEEGGVALPEDLGLRPPERVGGKTAGGSGATPPQRRGIRPPDGKQGEMLMPLRSANSESAKFESPGPKTPTSGPGDSNLATQISGGTENNNNKRDSESSVVVVVSDPAREAESAPGDSDFAAPVTHNSPAADLAADLAAALLPIVGRVEPVPDDLIEVASWLAAGRTPDEIKTRVANHMQVRPPRTFTSLRWFRAAVLNAAPPSALPAVPEVAPEPPENPAETIAWMREDPDHPALLDWWGRIRPDLRQSAQADWHLLRQMVLNGLDGDEIVISLPTAFARDWIRDHYGERISALWKRAYPEARRVDFRVNARAA